MPREHVVRPSLHQAERVTVSIMSALASAAREATRPIRGRIVSSRRRRRCIKIQPTRCPPGCSWGSLRSQRRQELVITAHRPAVRGGRQEITTLLAMGADPADLLRWRQSCGGRRWQRPADGLASADAAGRLFACFAARRLRWWLLLLVLPISSGIRSDSRVSRHGFLWVIGKAWLLATGLRRGPG
jgi:hypothetical protein